MTKILVVTIVWSVALALIGWGDAEHWRLLAGPLTIATGAFAIGMFTLGVGGIVYYGVGILRLRRELRQFHGARRSLH